MAVDTEAMHASIRVAGNNPDHHLWNNHGIWWCHFTVHQSDFTKRRIRRSTGTRDRLEARRVRDALLSAWSVCGPVASAPVQP